MPSSGVCPEVSLARLGGDWPIWSGAAWQMSNLTTMSTRARPGGLGGARSASSLPVVVWRPLPFPSCAHLAPQTVRCLLALLSGRWRRPGRGDPRWRSVGPSAGTVPPAVCLLSEAPVGWKQEGVHFFPNLHRAATSGSHQL